MSFGLICLIIVSTFIVIFIYSLIVTLKEMTDFDKDMIRRESDLTTEKNLFEYYRKKENFANELLRVQPKMVFVKNDCMEVFITNKALCYFKGNKRYYETFPLKFDTIHFKLFEQTETCSYQTTKDKSVVGRAIVGGIIGGGAGAVVGAASGLSNGGKKAVTQTATYYNGKYEFAIFPTHSNKNITIKPEYILIKKSLAKRINFAKRMENKKYVSLSMGGREYELNKTAIYKTSLPWLKDSSYEVYGIYSLVEDEKFAEKMMQCLKMCTNIN